MYIYDDFVYLHHSRLIAAITYEVMPRTLRTIEVVMLVFSIPAVLSAGTRIMLRRHRIWADDVWALVSLLALIVQIAAVFIYTEDQNTGVVRYYTIAVAFYAIIWTARLSLLFSVIRIDPNRKRRKWLYGIGTLYVVACLLLITQLLWICEHESQWKTMQTPQCHLTLPIGVAQLTTDILADGTLLLAPMLIFRTLGDRRLSRRLMAIFSTCVITTIVSLVHAAFLLSSAGLSVVIAGAVEANHLSIVWKLCIYQTHVGLHIIDRM
ncbi:hypothetical protein M378DRAFT_962597 [Amanita muscaria Koide BX008]|uniref:Rhodopsin domain-containing protein n=1 Tax=Amanita muscaria (strain Koide BX008) TaxID=946122 RepID=A0A0C2WEY4_AMAMK|nr:hypothetical protein M378DRAFT_962597 [Amanita muscaria Koide BX008]